MNFASWYKKQPKGTYKRLHFDLGVASATVYKLRKGGTIDSYSLASLISEATGGEVSIDELCRAKAKGKRS